MAVLLSLYIHLRTRMFTTRYEQWQLVSTKKGESLPRTLTVRISPFRFAWSLACETILDCVDISVASTAYASADFSVIVIQEVECTTVLSVRDCSVEPCIRSFDDGMAICNCPEFCSVECHNHANGTNARNNNHFLRAAACVLLG